MLLCGSKRDGQSFALGSNSTWANGISGRVYAPFLFSLRPSTSTMPSFYPQAMSGQLSHAPTEFVPGYESHACRSAQYTQDSYQSQNAMPPRLDSAVCYPHQYAQSQPHQSQPSAYQHASGYQGGQNLPPISSYYEPAGAPILPPLRIQDNQYSTEHDYRLMQDQHNQIAAQQPAQQQQQPPPKEEKATGGVSAKLDYEMERMTDFVAQSAQQMYALHLSGMCLADIDICRSIKTGYTVQPSFRKWVSQVLCATRLPSATIMLSLHYLSVRMKEYPHTVGQSENQIYRLLAVSMILGSKFLDDNTFINRSWSDVTGIKVSEINVMEIEWLALICFDLHTDPSDPKGVSAWIRSWKEYETSMSVKAQAAALTTKLSPLDTSLGRRQTTCSNDSGYQSNYSQSAYDSYTPLSSTSAAPYRSTSFVSADPWNRQEPMSADPYSSQYGSHSRYPEQSCRYSQSQLGSSYSRNALPPLQSFTSSYYSPWNQTPRSGAHDYGCTCMMCARPYNSYPMGFGYPAQTVVG